jgi:outer membrane protein assembly factor BamE (lipoprotein component of BamABCDE complex)
MKYQWTGVIILLVCAAFLSFYADPKTRLDGWEGALLSVFFYEDTEYAPGYSDSKFLQVKPGMTDSEVPRLLGAPLNCSTNTDGSIYMRWSQSPGSNNYRHRSVSLKNGKVEYKYSEFYLD